MIPEGFRPTLAYKVGDFADLRYPVLSSPKIDGIRCVCFGIPLTRTLRAVRNKYIQQTLQKVAGYVEGFDGELVVPGKFNEVASAIMAEEGNAEQFQYLVFDWYDRLNFPETYQTRFYRLSERVRELSHPHIKLVPQTWIDNAQSLMAAETRALTEGYEGLMIRSPTAPYKFGRSTPREGYLGKIKRFMDAEAEITGFEPLYVNENPQTVNRLGLAERGHDQALLVEQPLLGKFICRGLHNNKTFGVGSGFTARQRKEFWQQKEQLAGKIIKYKYLPYGVLDLPRHPIFLGFRERSDIGEPG